MPASELVEWSLFEDEFGPITLQERVDIAAGMIGWRVAGEPKGTSVEDFMPKWESGRNAPHVMDFLSALARR